jgi:hypothetical protein
MQKNIVGEWTFDVMLDFACLFSFEAIPENQWSREKTSE